MPHFGHFSQPSQPSLPNHSSTDAALELYKLEYERCAIRYQDIYKAIWTNFSYLAVVAGAILTFGGDRFQPELSTILSCVPLFFWWLATFEPLNSYGDKVAARLQKIEAEVNSLCGVSLNHYSAFENRKGIGVRWRVRAFFLFLLLPAVLYSSWRACELHQAGEPLLYRRSTEVKTLTIDFKEKPLAMKVTGIDLDALKELLKLNDAKLVLSPSGEAPKTRDTLSLQTEN